MIDGYIKEVNKRKSRQEKKEIYIFGYGFGTITVLVFMAKYLLNNKNLSWDKYYIGGIVVGVIILLCTIVYPESLKRVKNIVGKIINGVVYIVYVTLLVVIYCLCIFPIGVIMQMRNNKKNKYEQINSTFVEKEKSGNKGVKTNKNRIYQISSIIQYFMRKEYIIILPTLVLIIIIGIVFAFLQSSIVAPFIYTLF